MKLIVCLILLTANRTIRAFAALFGYKLDGRRVLVFEPFGRTMLTDVVIYEDANTTLFHLFPFLKEVDFACCFEDQQNNNNG
jgi:hypothetical protein